MTVNNPAQEINTAIESIRDAAPSIISTEGMSEMDNAEHKISKMKKVSLICQATAESKINA